MLYLNANSLSGPILPELPNLGDFKRLRIDSYTGLCVPATISGHFREWLARKDVPDC